MNRQTELTHMHPQLLETTTTPGVHADLAVDPEFLDPAGAINCVYWPPKSSLWG